MTTFMFNKQENHPETMDRFDVNAVLTRNGWRSDIQDFSEAEKILKEKEAFTFVLYPSKIKRGGFTISFVGTDGNVHHDHFTLLDSVLGIWKNGHSSHVGKLEKVLCDMMHCFPYDLKPL